MAHAVYVFMYTGISLFMTIWYRPTSIHEVFVTYVFTKPA